MVVGIERGLWRQIGGVLIIRLAVVPAVGLLVLVVGAMVMCFLLLVLVRVRIVAVEAVLVVLLVAVGVAVVAWTLWIHISVLLSPQR